MLERFKVVLVRLCVLDQVLFHRVVFILLAIVHASEEHIEGEAIVMLHTVPVANGAISPQLAILRL